MKEISPADFDFVRALVRTRSGMVLENGKEYLVEARLRRLARQEQVASLAALVEQVRRAPEGSGLRAAVVESVLIGESHFFRDGHPFEALRREILPALIEAARTRRRLDIWCAASATGQEPYSLAMVLADFPELATWDVRLMASDLSEEMLRRVQEGRYSEAEAARGLPPALRERWFQEGPPHTWTVRESLRRRVELKKINLVEPWPHMPRLDLIMIRNVLIYFDEATKHDIIQRAHDLLRPGGYLMLGTSESLSPEREHFEQLRFGQTICYRRA
jgi:chemotaxis protein methyltransferase CheR